jgi:Tfp pilus assembly protein PilV
MGGYDMSGTRHFNDQRKHARDDQGFTLVELLITLVVGPIIIGGLVAMILLVFSTQTGVSNRISGAVDAQLTTTNLQSDVQNASYVTTSTTPSCGSSGTQVFGTETDGTTVIVSYDVVKSGSHYSLIRYSCASSNTTSPTGQTTLSNDIPSTQKIIVSCSATCTTTTGWTTASIVSDVALSVTEPHTLVYYSLSSTPRAWSPPTSSSGGSPVPDVTVLGSSSATNNCSSAALSLSSDSGIQYGGGNDEVTWGSSCTTTSVQSSSTWNGDSENYSSWYDQYGSTSSTSNSSNTSDPLSGVTNPTYSNPSGSGTDSGGTWSSGTYGSTTTISGTNTFGSGTYVFTNPVTITGTCTFGSGTYVFEGGVSISCSGGCNLGTGTYICSSSSSSGNGFSCSGSCKCSCGSSGCEICVNKGCCSFTNTGGTSLCGKSSCSGVCVWDTCSNPSGPTPCVSLCGNTSSTTSCNYGGVYCPDGSCSCSGGKCTTSFVDCGALSVGSGSTLCVG